jgi:hypothetical protein
MRACASEKGERYFLDDAQIAQETARAGLGQRAVQVTA